MNILYKITKLAVNIFKSSVFFNILFILFLHKIK